MRRQNELQETNVVYTHILLTEPGPTLSMALCSDHPGRMPIKENMSSLLRRMALPFFFLAGLAPASAGVIEQYGVTFTSNTSGNVLTLEIDAASRSGGWQTARYLDAIGIKTSSAYRSATLSSASGINWQLDAAELNANGCEGGNSKKATSYEKLCIVGTPTALGDDMVFTFTFNDGAAPDAAHLKVRFLDASGKKIDELLSQDFEAGGTTSGDGTQPGTATEGTQSGSGNTDSQLESDAGDTAGEPQPAAVPEPQTLALLAGGLALLTLLRRRKPRA